MLFEWLALSYTKHVCFRQNVSCLIWKMVSAEHDTIELFRILQVWPHNLRLGLQVKDVCVDAFGAQWRHHATPSTLAPPRNHDEFVGVILVAVCIRVDSKPLLQIDMWSANLLNLTCWELEWLISMRLTSRLIKHKPLGGHRLQQALGSSGWLASGTWHKIKHKQLLENSWKFARRVRII